MLIIDRFEGDKAVIEDSENEKMISLEKNMIEDTAREGDVIFFADGIYKADTEATAERRTEIWRLLKSVDIMRRSGDNGE